MVSINVNFLRNKLKPTYAAFAAIQSPARYTIVRSLSISTFANAAFFAPLHSSYQPSHANQLNPTRMVGSLYSSFSSLSSSSSFQPANPPGTFGTPVFPDILDLSQSVKTTTTDNSTNQNNTTSTSTITPEAILRNTSPETVIVVTGANRGIGLQFVQTLLQHTQGKIVACCRCPDQAIHLQELMQHESYSNRIGTVALDMESTTSMELAGTYIRDNYDRIDLLLNVAGILGDGQTTPGPERSLEKMDRSWFEKTLAVNLIGPVLWTKELTPLLKQKRRPRNNNKNIQNTTTTTSDRPPAIVVNMSARVGSISDNQLGGWYSYRISKAGLNQATRTMALEMKRHNVWALAMHPGTTDTGLSQPFQANVKDGSLFPVEFTVERLLLVIDSMKEEHSGGLYDWAGQALSF